MKGELLALALASKLELFGGVNSEAGDGDLIDIVYLNFNESLTSLFQRLLKKPSNHGKKG